MRHLVLLAFATAALSAADSPAFTCKPVMISAGAELPAAIGFTDRPMGYELGCKIAYLVEGEDLIGFKKDSLLITAITTADGKDFATKRNGKPSWKQGHFPKTTDDGKYGIFTIEVNENLFGRTDGLNITGTIVALSGTDRQTKKLTLKVGDAAAEDVGGLKVVLVSDKSDPDDFGVQVTGDIAKVAEITVLDGTTKLTSRGSSWSGTQRTWNFAQPAGATVTVEFTWWNKLTMVTVPIGKP